MVTALMLLVGLLSASASSVPCDITTVEGGRWSNGSIWLRLQRPEQGLTVSIAPSTVVQMGTVDETGFLDIGEGATVDIEKGSSLTLSAETLKGTPLDGRVTYD